MNLVEELDQLLELSTKIQSDIEEHVKDTDHSKKALRDLHSAISSCVLTCKHSVPEVNEADDLLRHDVKRAVEAHTESLRHDVKSAVERNVEILGQEVKSAMERQAETIRQILGTYL
jgi:hypothetical protein